MNILNLIKKIIEKDDNISENLNSENLSTERIISLSKERAMIEDIANLGREYIVKIKERDDLQSMMSNELSLELKEMAFEEMNQLDIKIFELEKELKILLLPKDPSDSKNAIIEIRAGTGGDEAALFASEICRMYQKYAEKQKWKIEIVSIDTNDIGGIKDSMMIFSGKDVFAKMRFESGTHRVQRVPKTENNGRVHTSAITIAVLPELDDIDIKILDKDLKIDVFRSGGAGGQHVNKTESAVRITHIPTGIVIVQQDDRSQIKNKEKGMKILRAKLYEYEEEQRNKAVATERRSQIGSGDRSEKIRTYNFPQNRMTDHRVDYTNHNLEKVIEEGNLDELIERLRNVFESERLASVE